MQTDSLKQGKQLFGYDVPQCQHVTSIYHQKGKELPLHKGNLFLGGVGSFKEPTITNFRISTALSVLDAGMMKRYMIKEKCEHLQIKTHKWVDLHDEEEVDIFPHIDECVEYLVKSLQEGNVLVHCQVGMSRSATIVTAFIMKFYGIPLKEALIYVKNRRSIACPNQGFMKALSKYEKQVLQQK